MLLFAGDAAVIFHDRFVQIDECFGDGRASLHGENAVRAKPQRLVEELCKLRHVLIVVAFQGGHQRHGRNRKSAQQERQEQQPDDQRLQ